MKITVEFLSLPVITRVVGGKTVTMQFPGRTVGDLIGEIVKKYGEDVGRFLLDDSGKLDMTLKILLNKKQWLTREQTDTPLAEGDTVTLMMLVGGG